MIVSATKIFEFEAAHSLPNHEGDCRNLHGHSYKLEVEVGLSINNAKKLEGGMVIDFKKLKEIVQSTVIGVLDHKNLNNFYSNPTAENMSIHIYEILKMKIETGIKLLRIRLWETSSSYVEVKNED